MKIWNKNIKDSLRIDIRKFRKGNFEGNDNYLEEYEDIYKKLGLIR